jgi:hypothetical protein
MAGLRSVHLDNTPDAAWTIRLEVVAAPPRRDPYEPPRREDYPAGEEWDEAFEEKLFYWRRTFGRSRGARTG